MIETERWVMDVVKHILLCLLFISLNCFAGHPQNADIIKKINAISHATNNVIGVSAIYLETKQKISYNGGMSFFMASTVKVPIAIKFLHDVDDNQDSLDHIIHLSRNDAVPGSGYLYRALNRGSVNISAQKLLKLMLTVSDNSASDAILHEV